MTWTYAVLQHGENYAIHAFYQDEDSFAVSANPQTPMGETPEELVNDLVRMMACTRKDMAVREGNVITWRGMSIGV